MATAESMKRAKRERARALKENPLLALHLGDLVMKMHVLLIEDPNVTKPKKEVPYGSKDNYTKYQDLVKELNRRESRYTRIPLSEMHF